MIRLYGLEVVVSEYCVSADWIFEQHPFFEWEEKDKKFCIEYGFGHWGPSRPCAYQFGDVLYVHPEIYRELERTVGRDRAAD
jgi:hypothetical protein